MKTIKIATFLSLVVILAVSCKSKPATEEQETEQKVLVKTVIVQQQAMAETMTFNGQTVYLNKNTLTSPISGYALKVQARFGDTVNKGQVLFEIQTRENKALDSNDGIVKVLAPVSGYISEMNILETGVYLTEGSLLCTLVASNDVMVKASIPYENHSLVQKGTICNLLLQDGSSMAGTVQKILPVMDSEDQTQQVFIQPTNVSKPLPENLNLLVLVNAENHPNALVVPSVAVMSNETLTDFWVMKLVDGKTAIQVPVEKGIRTDSLTEIISPELKAGDIIISEGAYGLPDSSIVELIN